MLLTVTPVALAQVTTADSLRPPTAERHQTSAKKTAYDR